jgi:hypothetical protein
MSLRIWAIIASLGILAAAQGALAGPGYHLESAVKLPGASPAWDYLTLDPARPYLFLGRRADGVLVYDTRRGAVVRRIKDSEGADIARLAPAFDRGYTANEDGTTTVFQLSTLETLARVKLGESADSALFESATGQMVFTLGDTRELVFLDARTARPTGRVKVDSEELEGMAADGDGRFFVNERDKNRVAEVDARARQVLAEWPTPGCEEPTGMAIDAAAHRLFIGCRGEHPVLTVMDAQSGHVVATLEIGRDNDGVAYDAAARRIFTSNGVDANVVVFDQLGPDAYRFAGAFTTRPLARTMALDPATHRIFTVAAEGVVDPARPINKRAGAFYPNRYLDDTFTVLTYAPD